MRALFKIFTSKLFLMLIIVCAQLISLAFALVYLNDKIPYFYIASGVLAGVFILYIVNADINPAYKVAWIIPIAAMPIFGVCAYFLFGKRKLSRRSVSRYIEKTSQIYQLLEQKSKVTDKLQNTDTYFYRLSNYIYTESHFPVYQLEDIVYFPTGEQYFESLKKKLLRAKKFIFLEYFIIDKGVMWDEVFDILKQKAAVGIDVRLIYDDAGTIMRIGHSYRKHIEKFGIKVYLFNPFMPIVDSQLNHRTHRKIAVIDGKYAFTGGINLADEYINKISPLGHWKDNGVLVKGEVVKSFTLMFLQLWAHKHGVENFENFIPQSKRSFKKEETSFITAFSDSPYDNRNVYENVYIKTIYNAKEYVYINTPYLVLDNEMKTALITAAKSGVDVRICVPHKPDKRYVFMLTRAFYTELIKEGVRVYEYMPGFIHAKSLVSDGKYAVIGTSNIDFRSFYLHFECGTAIYCPSFAKEMTQDFLSTTEISREITKEMTKIGVIKRLMRAILRLFAPLM